MYYIYKKNIYRLYKNNIYHIMTSVQIMNRINKLEKLLDGNLTAPTSQSIDPSKLVEFEKKISELTKKTEDFQKVTNENTKNIAQNLKTLQEAITKLELLSKNTNTVVSETVTEAVDEQQTTKKKKN